MVYKNFFVKPRIQLPKLNPKINKNIFKNDFIIISRNETLMINILIKTIIEYC